MKRVLDIIPFKGLFPPMNGGMLRAINLLNQLAKNFEVTAIMHQDRNEFLKSVDEYPAFKNIGVISTGEQKAPADLFAVLPEKFAKALRFRYWNRSLRGPGNDDFLKIHPVLNRLLKEKEFDYVILEDMSLLNIAKVVRRLLPRATIIYDAYNVNSRLAAASLSSGAMSVSEYERLKKNESEIYKLVDYVFTCSELDLGQLTEMNRGKLKGFVIPNGVGIPSHSDNITVTADNDDLLFCGSLDYFPNREGLLWFCREILPLVLKLKPSARLMVVGKGDPGGELRQELQHRSIINYGKVDSVADYYKKAAIAVVPLISGSGTRLKLLEAMGYKVPVVSTSAGAEGIEYVPGQNIMIADDSQAFANGIAQLLNNREQAKNIAEKAFSFVKKRYDWNGIGTRIHSYLNNIS